jgi:hypothetical protein
MNLTLNSQLSRLLIEGEIKSGRFSTPEDLMAAGVSRRLAESDLSAEELADLRVDLEVGTRQADCGEFTAFTAKAGAKKHRGIKRAAMASRTLS